MIPRKRTDREKAAKLKFLKSLPRVDALKKGIQAADNSARRFNPSVRMERYEKSIFLRVARAKDRKLLWGVSFHANLAATNKALGVNLDNLVKLYASKGRVLEIGCGSGKAISELQQKNPSARFYATGAALSEEWVSHPNYKLIDWRVGSIDKLSKLFGSKKFDLVYSNLGIGHAHSVREAIAQLGEIVNEHGVVIFNVSPRDAPEANRGLRKGGFLVNKPVIRAVPTDSRLQKVAKGNHECYLFYAVRTKVR